MPMSFPKQVFRLPLAIFSICLTCSALAQTNGVLREVYYNIAGNAVSDLLNAPAFPSRPNEEFIESAFEAPVNFADSYGQRMRALLVPPTTGSYVFWVSSDDNSILYLSTDADPAHKAQIASVTSWTNPRQWNLSASQKSAAVTLTNGFRYYIEALQKEGAGGATLAVPGKKRGVRPRAPGAGPIPANSWVPSGLAPPVTTVHPASQSVLEGGSATFT